MKIAVTYENGQIFQHFGHTKEFKVYETENGAVVSQRIVNAGGSGHGALAALLQEQGINVLICGGIGGGAVAALAEHGVELCGGASGSADEAVQAYLRGELVNTGANCSHHHGEDHACGSGDDHACGSGDDHACGGESHACGGCRTRTGVQGKNAGKTCRVHYRGTFNDGKQFDSSYDRGEPLSFVCGAGQMIRGFDAAVADMEVGEVRQIHLMPAEAYGEADPNAVFTVPIAELPGAETLSVGRQVYLQSDNGRPFPVKVVAKTAETITFDANHEMAGKELNFTVELLEVSEA